MNKIAFGPLIRHVITLLIGFFVARNMLSADVAAKLYAGDTVELWGGAWSVSLKQITDFLVNSWPVLVPILLSVRGRLIDRYRLIIARLSSRSMTHTEVKNIAAAAPITKVIKTIAAKP